MKYFATYFLFIIYYLAVVYPYLVQYDLKELKISVLFRAHRGRTMSLCLISSPLDLQQWEIDNQNKNRVFSEESEENSAVNSEDEGVSILLLK